MIAAKRINAEHKDLIHGIAYDFYGLRMATCSSDQTVKVWDLDHNETWVCSSEWKSHYGSVWRVQWANPAFGQVLATCSIDRSAVIWEEIVESSDKKTMWVRRASLVDSKTPVMDIKFSPKHLGLQLATCSQDGVVRIYEASDIMKLSQWNLHPEIHTQLTDLSCLSWSTSRRHAPLIAVGSESNIPGLAKVQVHMYNESTRSWSRIEAFSSVIDAVHDVAFAPAMGRSFQLLAIAGPQLLIYKLENASEPSKSGSPYHTRIVATIEDHKTQVWRLSWNLTGSVLASSGDDGFVRMYQGNYMDIWEPIGTVKGDTSRSAQRARVGATKPAARSANRPLSKQ